MNPFKGNKTYYEMIVMYGTDELTDGFDLTAAIGLLRHAERCASNYDSALFCNNVVLYIQAHC